MALLKSLVLLLLVPALGNKACAADVAEEAGDVTSLMQNKVDVLEGAARASDSKEKKVEATASEKKVEAPQVSGSTVSKTSLATGGPRHGMITKGIAEFVAMTLFVFIGCGSAMANKDEEHGTAWRLQVALTFGLAITGLAYAIGHISGGQINCAVTLGLVVSGNLGILQALVNFGFQMLGSVFGSWLTSIVFPDDADKTGGYGTNQIADEYRNKSKTPVFVAEVIGTFLLVFVVHETAVNPVTGANRALACLAIGISVFLAHSVLIPIDGCSINPTRSFGPMIVRVSQKEGWWSEDKRSFAPYVADHWIFWVGPLVGAALAALLYMILHQAD